ncbi:Hypothetical protein SRAE_1000217400 [Strongyloides ratti]|uniref:DUF7584 domain-containing protein n=1 Tax=Strongyloides ratti TaxID=34506 RepID=A0A090L718_STRRB|nr:Hypothetical protein SRAE_1000217400 [Strongyloides ratti]CEF63918.1 Hypothetical protein SRAE_1000217400 [Strongyloides ratti]
MENNPNLKKSLQESKSLPKLTNECVDNQNNIVVLSKNQSYDPLAGGKEIYYSFSIPNEQDKNQLEYPCEIFKTMYGEPEITIVNYASSLLQNGRSSFHLIKQKQISQGYNMKLHLNGDIIDPDFYKDKKIMITKTRFLKDSVQNVSNFDSKIFTTLPKFVIEDCFVVNNNSNGTAIHDVKIKQEKEKIERSQNKTFDIAIDKIGSGLSTCIIVLFYIKFI